MGRFFFAVLVPPEGEEVLRRVVAELQVDAPGALRWVPPENAHCTLRFLGELAVAEVELAVRAADHVGPETSPFSATTSGASVFDDVRRAHTLWLGFDAGAAELGGLAARLSGVLEARGFSRERRAFVAHVTVARFPSRWRPHEVRALLLSELPSLTFSVTEFVLMQSVPEGRRVRYVVVQRFALRHDEV